MFLFIIFLKILGILLCVILSLLILLIFIPFYYNLHSHINETIALEGTISWMFHLFKMKFSQDENLKITFFIGNKAIHSNSEKKHSQNKEDKHHKKPKKSKKNNIKDFIRKKFISCVLSYFKDMLKIVKPNEIKIHGVYGFYDPSITGLLCGFIPIVAQIIPNSNINLNPVFDDDVINIETIIYGKIFLFLIIFRTLKFILKKDIRKILFKKSKTVET